MIKPANHVKSFTYKPKIKPVLSGKIKQTIRPIIIKRFPTKPINQLANRYVKVGDSILFHGWVDVPYRSKWSWRIKVIATLVEFLKIYQEGISSYRSEKMEYAFCHPTREIIEWPELNELAKDDGIKPATGEELGRLFNQMYKLESFEDCMIDLDATKYFQIIKWDDLELKK